MEEVISDVTTGIIAILLALLGLILAAGAHDQGMLVFGLGLTTFGTLFVFGRIGAYFDRKQEEVARHG